MDKFFDKYGINGLAENVANYYTEALTDYEKYGDKIMDFEQYNIYTYMKDDIARIRGKLVWDRDNIVYCYTLARAIGANDRAAIKQLSKPRAQDNDELFDTLPLFALLWFIPEMRKKHGQMGIPSDVTEATCNMFENQVQDFVDLNHRYGISHYVGWLKSFLDCKIVRIGRFNFEKAAYNSPFDVFENDGRLAVLPKGVTFHRNGQILGGVDCSDEEVSFFADIEETDDSFIGYRIENGIALNERVTFKKSEWKRVLTQGDDIISVHIPSGGRMDDEVCDRDIARCREIFDTCFGGYKAFYCNSWLLDPQIKTIMGKDTNLTKFADRYTKFPTKNIENDVFEYVYLLSHTTPLEELPENTSFGRAVKQHLMEGKHIYGARGVFL